MLDEPVFIHPHSVLYKADVDYVVYQTMEESSRLYMKGICCNGVTVDTATVFWLQVCQQ